ncbi:hypothetical protein FA95DRAFT_123405 [Auriscalpium vulgare]|uniref:Uncharacterized protein n=1 Tax=Auriscalpium vulgare TaxID=40419 RepID=A0ACB8RMV2_9AGAM|nr:hypothetical protein FA95DRAFT_123405 [Auriscalpium vulgare]
MLDEETRTPCALSHDTRSATRTPMRAPADFSVWAHDDAKEQVRRTLILATSRSHSSPRRTRRSIPVDMELSACPNCAHDADAGKTISSCNDYIHGREQERWDVRPVAHTPSVRPYMWRDAVRRNGLSCHVHRMWYVVSAYIPTTASWLSLRHIPAIIACALKVPAVITGCRRCPTLVQRAVCVVIVVCLVLTCRCPTQVPSRAPSVLHR